jgi:Domain of unknown function (DUF4350)
MKGRLAIFLTVVVVVVVLVALNAASYVRVERPGDSEFSPDRSTMNAGATGTRALFEYLQQSGREVVRWGQPPAALLEGPRGGGERPSTFVVVGRPRQSFEGEEAGELLRWVGQGGRLVLIDREPDAELLPAVEGWHVTSQVFEYPGPTVAASDVEAMTRGVPLIGPSQPTALTRDVAQVTRSRFAGRLSIQKSEPPPPPKPTAAPRASVPAGAPKATPTLPPAPAATPQARISVVVGDAEEELEEEDEGVSPAPVEHLPDGREGRGALLVDFAYGGGRIVVLSDPYVVANAGINRADNLLLAVNVVAGAGGLVAFDEYHQGYGTSRHELFAYFSGTPILWMFAQAAAVALAVVWTRGRRFARPLPAPHVDRRSKLEFVASMAELQQRARAYDLAVENIYARTRRALARYAGLGSDAPAADLAARVAARSGRDAARLEALLRECEDSIAGARLAPRRAVELARALRELERDLGLLMRAREVRQAR